MDCRRTRVKVAGVVDVAVPGPALRRPDRRGVPCSQRHLLVLLRDSASQCRSRSEPASLEKEWGVVFRPPPGDEVVHAFTNTLRSAAGPTEKGDRTPPQARPLCQPLAVAQSNQHRGSDPPVLKSFEKKITKIQGPLHRPSKPRTAHLSRPARYQGVTKFFNNFPSHTDSVTPKRPSDEPDFPPNPLEWAR